MNTKNGNLWWCQKCQKHFDLEHVCPLRVGDEVEVIDEGLAMLRCLAPGMPPNNVGRITELEGDIIMVEFPIDGTYGHSQVAPYSRSDVKKRKGSNEGSF